MRIFRPEVLGVLAAGACTSGAPGGAAQDAPASTNPVPGEAPSAAPASSRTRAPSAPAVVESPAPQPDGAEARDAGELRAAEHAGSASDPWIAHGFTEKQRASLRAFLPDAVAEDLAAGGSVRVEHRGEVVLEEAFGFSDRRTRRPFTIDTLRCIASISKPMVATAIVTAARRDPGLAATGVVTQRWARERAASPLVSSRRMRRIQPPTGSPMAGPRATGAPLAALLRPRTVLRRGCPHGGRRMTGPVLAFAAVVASVLPTLAACGERDRVEQVAVVVADDATQPVRVGSVTSPPTTPGQDLNARIEVLRRRLIPPPGTPKEAVVRVYGAPHRVVEKLTGKGSPRDYPMEVHVLLPATDPKGDYVRASLWIHYRDGCVHHGGIHHLCVIAGWPIGRATDVAARERERAERERESHGVLADLEEIGARFSSTLATAPWAQ